MDHLGFPAEYQSRLPQIPHLAKAPKYDYLGFDGFPERHGINSQDLLSVSKEKISSSDSGHPLRGYDPLFIQSLLQEWLWFGIMHEFELACGQPMNRDELIEKDFSSDGNILSTKSLLSYVKAVVVSRLLQAGVPLDLKVGDQVHLCDPQSLLPDGTFSKSVFTQVTSIRAGILVSVDGVPDQSPAISIALIRRPMNRHDKSTSDADSQIMLSLMALCKVIHQLKISYDNIEQSDKALRLKIFAPRVFSMLTLPFKCRTRLLKNHSRPENIKSRLNRTNFFDILRKAEQITYALSQLENSVLNFESLLSFDILLNSLNCAWSNICGQYEENSMQSSFYSVKFKAMMQQNGWCPSRIWPIVSWQGFIHQYLSSLLPSNETLIHPDSCSDLKCAKRPKDTKDIKPQHRTSCNGSCQAIAINQDKLIEILRSGGNPALRLIKLNSDELATYEVVDSRGLDFVAITHVWSHGLGNPSQNALPQCQLKYLFKVIGMLLPCEPLLWIDTVSVPIVNKWKTVAISRLRQVYREAERVLVIDKHLEQVGESEIERKIQIAGSEWMTRLWTLQEGQLASDLFFQFRKEAVSFSQLSLAQDDFYNDHEYDIFSRIAKRSASTLLYRLRPETRFRSRFLELANELKYRSVTEPKDEPICLATLLGLEIEKFHTSVPTMTDIYQNISEIPQGMIFGESKRLQVRGFRWAPASFLGSNSPNITWTSGNKLPGRLHYPHGLMINYDCIVMEHDLEFSHSKSTSDEVIYLRNPKDGGILGFCSSGPEASFEITKSWNKEAIILAQPYNEFERVSAAVLVHSVCWRSGVMYCSYGLSGFVWHFNTRTADWDRGVRGCTTPENPLQGAEYRHSLRICID